MLDFLIQPLETIGIAMLIAIGALVIAGMIFSKIQENILREWAKYDPHGDHGT